jgi:hypothetical protein
MKGKASKKSEKSLIDGKYILRSTIKWRFLRELQFQCDNMGTSVPITITPHGIYTVIRDSANVLHCEINFPKKAFEYYEAIDSKITLDVKGLRLAIMSIGNSYQNYHFDIEPGHAYLSYEKERVDIPIFKETGPHHKPLPKAKDNVTVPLEWLYKLLDNIRHEDSFRMDNSELTVGIGPSGLRISKRDGIAEVAWVMAGVVV